MTLYYENKHCVVLYILYFMFFSCSESFIYMTCTVSLSRNYCLYVAHRVKCYVSIPPTLSSTMSHTMFVHHLQCLDVTTSVAMPPTVSPCQNTVHTCHPPRSLPVTTTSVTMSSATLSCNFYHTHVTPNICMSPALPACASRYVCPPVLVDMSL